MKFVIVVRTIGEICLGNDFADRFRWLVLDGVIWCILDNVGNFYVIQEISENNNWLIGLYVAVTACLVLLNTAKMRYSLLQHHDMFRHSNYSTMGLAQIWIRC